jgi:transaldolase/glucose-6-phosphate isomerase
MTTSDLSWRLPGDLEGIVRDTLADLRRQDLVRRIWARDPTVWTGEDEDRWLGWLRLPMQDRSKLADLARFADEVRAEGTTDVVLLGMGGCSLAPDVLGAVFGRKSGYPALHVIDSTDPGWILSVERKIDYARTLFVVASKSGTTLEVNILKQYFHARAVEKLGSDRAGRRFVVVTDPGSKLEATARQEKFRRIFEGIPAVGGRFSALSNFGLVPAALIGVDLETFVDRAEAMATRCESDGAANAGLELGALLGALALQGRDKPTLIASGPMSAVGLWLEQLVAESLGKQGKGIIPIDGEQLGPPEAYGRDRVFVQLRASGTPDAAMDAALERLERAGHPVARIECGDRESLGAEFYRWEFATAVAGAVIGVNPFDQPDVEAAKVVTRRLAAEYEKTGTLPSSHRPAPPEKVGELLDQLEPGDYFATLAFIDMTPEAERALNAVRTTVRDRRKVATTVGFGPRYLHSTGQVHKGGPNSGVFLVITCKDPEDVAVPGQKYSFGTIKLAQALGDLEVLASRGRRVLRVHLDDVPSGLTALQAACEKLA